jgi:hypothetical protein
MVNNAAAENISLPQNKKTNNHLSHLKSLNIKKITTYGVRNPSIGLRQAYKCDVF